MKHFYLHGNISWQVTIHLSEGSKCYKFMYVALLDMAVHMFSYETFHSHKWGGQGDVIVIFSIGKFH